MTIIYFLIALSILIIVHEWGHFIVARLFGIRVEEFSVGFGPKIFGVKRGDTQYKVSALPFGGFVKMSGQDLSDLDKNDEKAFYNKSIPVRAAVVGAGPVMNIILCIILMPIVFMIGKIEPAFIQEAPVVVQVRAASPADRAGIEAGDLIVKVGEKEVKDWRGVISEVMISNGQDLKFVLKRADSQIETTAHIEEIPDGQGGYLGVEPPLYIGNEPVLDTIVAGSPAEQAGLKVGDEIVSIDKKPIESWLDMAEAVTASEGREINLGVKRNGKMLTIRLRPRHDEETGRYLMGVSKDILKRDIPMVKVRYGFFEGIREGLKEVWNLVELTFRVLGKLVTFQLSYKSLGGPIKIAQATAAAARTGLSSFIFFLSFLSLQLGILNLLPIPVLDGGHILFFGIEAVRRKHLPDRAMVIAQNVGLAFIIFILVIVSINDIIHLESVQKIIDKLF